MNLNVLNFRRLARLVRFIPTLILFIFLFKGSDLSAQTYQFGGNESYFASQLLSSTMKYDGGDSTYVFSGGFSGGITGAFFFDHGGYYSRKIYGIRMEVNYSRLNQSYRFFPGQGIIDPEVFYKYRLRLSYIDVPLMFTFCPTHHQGLTVEAGPQISFLQSANAIAQESRNTEPLVPTIDRQNFKPTSFSFVAGAGIFYSLSETFAISGTFRAMYGLSSLIKSGTISTSATPDRRLTLGITAQAIMKINKYDAKKNRGYKYYLKRARH
jgi:hypothetical protein